MPDATASSPASAPVRTVVHLSDLHFGREDPAVVAGLVHSLTTINPDAVAVSGDLTQRARRQQFLDARAFLDALPFPRVVVPGNHDVPLYNIVTRLLSPLGGYGRHIEPNLAPVHTAEGILLLGLNTTQRWRVKDGRYRTAAIAGICERFRAVGDDVVKVLVAHHPFDPGDDEVRGWARGARALDALTRGGVDVILTGHMHVSASGHRASRYDAGGRSAVIVEAGTATSTRLREATNAFNVLRLSPSRIVVERYDWREGTFYQTDTQEFLNGERGWITAGRAERSR